MLRIQLEHALHGRDVLVHGLHDPFHVRVHAHLVGDQAAGGVGQAGREFDLLDFIFEVLLDVFDQGLVRFRIALESFILLFLLLVAMDVDVAAVDRPEGLAIIFVQALGDPFVDRIDKKEDFVILALQGFEVRRMGSLAQAAGSEEVDFLLPSGIRST